MRQIVFRGRCLNSPKWVYGLPYIEIINVEAWVSIREPRENGAFSEYQVDEETIGQFTGLKDKNGEPIFENDIIQGYIYPHRHIIEWNDKEASFVARLIGYQMMNDCGVNQQWIDECEKIVIGNKWDNPELLK